LQEDVERQTVALVMSAVRLTERELSKALSAFVDKLQKGYSENQTPHGKQSVKKLMNHNVATNSISLDGGKKETQLFDRMARKYNVDYAFHKVEPGKYLLFFKASQADAITACFSEYSKRVMSKGIGRPSIMAQLQKFAEAIKSRVVEPRQRDRAREAADHER